MNFDITPASPTPIYRQIVEQVRLLISSGQLRPGDDLPSVRNVALQHAINPMTVSKAYSMLETEGVLTRKRGVGMVISDSMPAHQDRLALLRPALMAATQITRQLNIDDVEALVEFKLCLNKWKNNESNDPV